jgi:hypothetical protein
VKTITVFCIKVPAEIGDEEIERHYYRQPKTAKVIFHCYASQEKIKDSSLFESKKGSLCIADFALVNEIKSPGERL